MVAQLYYDGSVGRHLEVESNINQVVGATSATQVHPFTALAATSPIRPGGAIASNIGYGTSNSYLRTTTRMWAVLSKNMSNGLEFTMNFEWTKSMDLNSLGSQGGLTLPDSTNPSENYGLSDFDVRQHFAGTAIYNLPFHTQPPRCAATSFRASSSTRPATPSTSPPAAQASTASPACRVRRNLAPSSVPSSSCRNRQRHFVPEHRPGLRRHNLRHYQLHLGLQP